MDWWPPPPWRSFSRSWAFRSAHYSLLVRAMTTVLAAQKLAEDRDRENRRMLSAIQTRLALQAYQRAIRRNASELIEHQLPGSRPRESSGVSGGRASRPVSSDK